MWDEQDWESAGQYTFRSDAGDSDLNGGRNDEWTFDKIQLEDLESEQKRPFMRPNAEKTGSFPSIFGPIAESSYQKHLERLVNLSCCTLLADWLTKDSFEDVLKHLDDLALRTNRIVASICAVFARYKPFADVEFRSFDSFRGFSTSRGIACFT